MRSRDGVVGSPRFYAFPPLIAIIAIAVLLVTPAAAAAQGSGGRSAAPARAVTDWAPPSTVYIPETGHAIDGVFLDFWRANSGISSYGYPITPEVIENDRIVQYFQFARFEYWPDDPNGQIVQLGAIGEELRPHQVLRSIPAAARERGNGGAAELAAMARAWLPLDDETASQPNTDVWRYVPETQHSVQYGFKELWEATGEASYLGYPVTEEYVVDKITYQVFERGQLAWKKNTDPWVVPLGEELAKRYKLNMAPVAQGELPIYDEALWIPPAPVIPQGGERWIEINLSGQYLIAWQGDVEVNSSYVSTGRPGFDTPTGTYFINSMMVADDMEGTLGGEYYNVPQVPWVMYFTGVGHAIHGAYWHNNFGAVMSHGCVNLPVDVAAWLFDFSSIGMRVEIHY